MRTYVTTRLGQPNVTQLHYARQGVITEEMKRVAERENLAPDLIRAERPSTSVEQFPPTERR